MRLSKRITFAGMTADMDTTNLIIARTKKWITDVVIGCNFCPFAAKEVKAGTVFYQVTDKTDIGECLVVFLEECKRLDLDTTIETSFLIIPEGFRQFDMYLNLVTMAERLLLRQNYEGVYQVEIGRAHV